MPSASSALLQPPPNSQLFSDVCARNEWLVDHLHQLDEEQMLETCADILYGIEFEQSFQNAIKELRWPKRLLWPKRWNPSAPECFALCGSILDALDPQVESRVLRALGEPLIRVLVEQHEGARTGHGPVRVLLDLAP